MNKPIFIDFGCGPNTKHLIRYRKKGYYVISVDRSEQDLYENSDMKNICNNLCGVIRKPLFAADLL